jgi:hypothetical protein
MASVVVVAVANPAASALPDRGRRALPAVLKSALPMRATFRSLVTLCALVAAACAGVSHADPVGATPLPFEIRSSTVPLRIDQPAARNVGKLIWRGGIAMKANSPSFGGWSDLVVSPDNKSLTSISDNGAWFTATLERDDKGDLIGVSNGTIGPLRDLKGQPLADKSWADAEGMARLPDGSWIVSFERNHRIWRYPTLDGTPQPVNMPGNFDKQPNNGGAEALAALPDGRIVAISEEYSLRANALVGWIGKPIGDGRYLWDIFEYVKAPYFNPTAMRQLPDGSFVVLERAFDLVRGVRARLVHFPAAALKGDAVIEGEELARLASPYTVDNLEGLAVTRGERGETLLWIIADDNFNPLQRNLLMLFELDL